MHQHYLASTLFIVSIFQFHRGGDSECYFCRQYAAIVIVIDILWQEKRLWLIKKQRVLRQWQSSSSDLRKHYLNCWWLVISWLCDDLPWSFNDKRCSDLRCKYSIFVCSRWYLSRSNIDCSLLDGDNLARRVNLNTNNHGGHHRSNHDSWDVVNLRHVSLLHR